MVKSLLLVRERRTAENQIVALLAAFDLWGLGGLVATSGTCCLVALLYRGEAKEAVKHVCG